MPYKNVCDWSENVLTENTIYNHGEKAREFFVREIFIFGM